MYMDVTEQRHAGGGVIITSGSGRRGWRRCGRGGWRGLFLCRRRRILPAGKTQCTNEDRGKLFHDAPNRLQPDRPKLG